MIRSGRARRRAAQHGFLLVRPSTGRRAFPGGQAPPSVPDYQGDKAAARQSRPGVINHRDGGRGLYFEDPDGHLLEIITRPYGSGS